MVKPREELLGAITVLDENNTGTVTASNAAITNVAATVHNARASAPTTGSSLGAFWIDNSSPTNPMFTRSDGVSINLGGTSDHGTLSGLSDDDHTQYVLVDGTRSMTGTLNMGTNNITNVGLVDGVDVSTHASRHINGGSDIIDGDRLDVDFVPVYYTRTINPSYTANYNQLTSHLYGLDLQLHSIIDSITDIDGVPASRTITAGNGLTGGGDLSANRTIDIVAADSTITVNADSIQVGVITDINHGNLSGGDLHALATESTSGFLSAIDKTKIDAINLDGYAEITHAINHQNGGSDEINVNNLSGTLADAQLVNIHRNGTLVGTQPTINFIEGAYVSLSISDNTGTGAIDVRISSTGGSGGTGAGTLSQTLDIGNTTDGYDIIVNNGSEISGSGTPISIVDGFNLNNYNIINVGTIDGYNLESQFYTINNNLSTLNSHIVNTSNPHNTSIANIGGGTLTQLNNAITDTDLVGIARTITAGNGLTGGGDLSTDRTINIAAADSTITVNADSIQVGVITDTNHGARGGGTLHAVVTTSVNGFMSYADKTKIDGIAAGAQVNPNIWSIFTDGTTTASPGTQSDSFRFRSANSILSVAIGSNDVTYGDNLLLTVNQGSIDHGSITGLSDDDHNIYLLVSGTRAMTGNLNMGGQQITNVGNVDGVDVSAHASRHNPGGIDAISTSTTSNSAVLCGNTASEGTSTSLARADHIHYVPANTTPSSVGSTNTIGTSTSLARADHVHAIGTHASRHVSGAADEIDGDTIDIDFVPSNYTSAYDGVYSTSTAHLSAHLNGINTKFTLLNSINANLYTKNWTGILANGEADRWIHLITLPASASNTLDGTRIEIIGGPWTEKPSYAYFYCTQRGDFKAKIVSGKDFLLAIIRIQAYMNADNTVSVYGYITSTYMKVIYNVSSEYYWAIGGLAEIASTPTGTLIWDSYTASDSVGNIESNSLTTTDNAIARWDSTTGKVIQNSTVTINDNGQMFFQNNQNIYFRNVTNTGYINAIASTSNTIYFGDTSYPTVIQGSTITTATSLNMGGNDITNVANVDGVDISNHDARHIAAGSDEINGDYIDIDFIGTNYTSQQDHVYSEVPNHLAAHLYGIDIALGYQSDHGNLTGLGDDDHTQYLLINGTRAMTGDLNMGTNDIWSVTSAGYSATEGRIAFSPGGTSVWVGSSIIKGEDFNYGMYEAARNISIENYLDIPEGGRLQFTYGGRVMNLIRYEGIGAAIIQSQSNWS
jgi:hypothetical protein